MSQDKIEYWNVESLEKVIHEKDMDLKNFDKNLYLSKVDAEDVLERTDVLAQPHKVTNGSEAVAYNLFSDDVTVYNTAGGSIISKEMTDSHAKILEDQRNSVCSGENDAPGNPDLVCFNSNNEPFMVEVKTGDKKLMKSQKKWINQNKWVDVYVLRLKLQAEFNPDQIISVSELIRSDRSKRKNTENIVMQVQN
jgi:hypothetical protein